MLPLWFRKGLQGCFNPSRERASRMDGRVRGSVEGARRSTERVVLESGGVTREPSLNPICRGQFKPQLELLTYTKLVKMASTL
jgi:hypothetical protein